MFTPITRAGIVTIAAAALIGGGTALASVPAPDGTITSCFKEKSEYFPDSGQCDSGWKKLTWNVKGPKGDTGPSGTSVVYAAKNSSDLPFGTSDVVLLDKRVPAGSYVVSAYVNLNNGSESESIVNCKVSADGNDGIAFSHDIVPAGGVATVALGGTKVDYAGGFLVVDCYDSGQAGGGRAVVSLTATKVDSIQ